MAANINRVVLVGNLTQRPRAAPHRRRHARVLLRIAVNTRRKDDATGEWADKPNYFTSPSSATRARTARSTSSKGRPVAIDGRLEWREWEAQDGTKREAVEIVADTVQFLGSRGEGGAGEAAATSSCPRARPRARTPTSAAPTTTSRSKETRGCTRRPTAPPRESGTAPTGGGRRKSCFFCKSKVDEVDYKNVNELRRYVSEKGKIRSRRISGACRRHQRQVAVAVKRARELALLPYVGDK